MASFSSRTDWAFLALLAVIVCAPFQRVDPLLVLPGQNLTNLEILAGIALGAWLLTHWIKGSWSPDLRAAAAVRWNAHSIFSGLRCSGGAAPGNRGLGFETKLLLLLDTILAVVFLAVLGTSDFRAEITSTG